MAYPNLRLDGQYGLKRVLTLPNAGALTASDLGKLVALDATGGVVAAPANAKFFGTLKTVTSDNFVTVDFSGVVKITASAAIVAGAAVVPSGSDKVKAVTTEVMTTKCVALTAAAADGDEFSAFFLI